MRSVAVWSAISAVLALYCASAGAMESPLRDASKLRRARRETGLQVATARVLVADYDLLRKDFPRLRSKSPDQIDAWLIDWVAYVTPAQTEQEAVNTHIELASYEREMLRPADYGRATVFEVPGGLIDVKGTGALEPEMGSHSNGLATLGEVIREYVYSRLIEMVLHHAGSEVEVVQTYGVIDWGFEVKQPGGGFSRAGAILRQGHRRSSGVVSILRGKRALPIERLLRSYGVTSTGVDRNRKAEEINIQASAEGALVDFGAYLTVWDFQKPVRNSFERPILMRPSDVGFPQPLARLRVPFEIWGSSVSGWEDPQGDNPWRWSHELAESIRRGTADRSAMLQHIRNLLDPVQEIFSREPSICDGALQGL